MSPSEFNDWPSKIQTFGIGQTTIASGEKITGIIVLYGWKVNVQEQNEIVGKLHIPRENFTFPRS